MHCQDTRDIFWIPNLDHRYPYGVATIDSWASEQIMPHRSQESWSWNRITLSDSSLSSWDYDNQFSGINWLECSPHIVLFLKLRFYIFRRHCLVHHIQDPIILATVYKCCWFWAGLTILCFAICVFFISAFNYGRRRQNELVSLNSFQERFSIHNFVVLQISF